MDGTAFVGRQALPEFAELFTAWGGPEVEIQDGFLFAVGTALKGCACVASSATAADGRHTAGPGGPEQNGCDA